MIPGEYLESILSIHIKADEVFHDVKEGAEYRFSVWARGENQKLRIELIKNDTMEERRGIILRN